MPDDLRPDVVAALSQPAQLPAELVDQVLDATDAEREAAAKALLEHMGGTRQALEQAGLQPPTVSILDAPYPAWAAIAAAFMTIHRTWELPGNIGKPPRDVVKIVDQQEAQWVMRLLRWGGLVAPEPEQ